MIIAKTLSFYSLLLASTASAQVYQSGDRSADAFSWTQPEDTVILGQYGDSEAVYPSRMSLTTSWTILPDVNMIIIARISGAGGWDDALEKARAFVAELTLEEKADMVTGRPGPCVGNIYPIPRLNFSGLCLQDGPASLRTADFVSSFPAGVTIASSWDKQMMYDRSLALGREFRAKGAQIALA